MTNSKSTDQPVQTPPGNAAQPVQTPAADVAQPVQEQPAPAATEPAPIAAGVPADTGDDVDLDLPDAYSDEELEGDDSTDQDQEGPANG